jgi:hypothetical protein
MPPYCITEAQLGKIYRFLLSLTKYWSMEVWKYESMEVWKLTIDN